MYMILCKTFKKVIKVKKGWLVVQVGLEEKDDDQNVGFQRFSIPISYLYHPRFQRLLEKARETFGYSTDGPLMLPCSVEDFLDLRQRVEREVRKYN